MDMLREATLRYSAVPIGRYFNGIHPYYHRPGFIRFIYHHDEHEAIQPLDRKHTL